MSLLEEFDHILYISGMADKDQRHSVVVMLETAVMRYFDKWLNRVTSFIPGNIWTLRHIFQSVVEGSTIEEGKTENG